MMQMLVIIVAEQNPDGWSAWLKDSPQTVSWGNSDILAILSLIETYGTPEMDPWDMTKLEARSYEGHLEYLLPISIGHRIPNSVTSELRAAK
ncbi:hypothetical protein [Schlesneria paludicola]|uniref:hypothetical protein n=1 Tax=Schlesneria paludicola TaxID=360056 RepID=UPI0002E9429E|nr:hypothetical protein [Schlesneria paludicola]